VGERICMTCNFLYCSVEGTHICLAAENELPVSYTGGCESWAQYKSK
jgi:hypothetical protein